MNSEDMNSELLDLCGTLRFVGKVTQDTPGKLGDVRIDNDGVYVYRYGGWELMSNGTSESNRTNESVKIRKKPFLFNCKRCGAVGQRGETCSYCGSVND